MNQTFDFSEIIQLLTRMLVVIPQLLVFFICLYYLIRQRSIDSILLTMGSLLSVFCLLFGIFIVPSLIQSGNIDNIQIYYAINAFFGFIATILFGIGLLIVINKALKKLVINP